MKKGESKVVKSFTDDREMAGWLASGAADALKIVYPPSQYSAKLDMVAREVTVTKKEGA